MVHVNDPVNGCASGDGGAADTSLFSPSLSGAAITPSAPLVFDDQNLTIDGGSVLIVRGSAETCLVRRSSTMASVVAITNLKSDLFCEVWISCPAERLTSYSSPQTRPDGNKYQILVYFGIP